MRARRSRMGAAARIAAACGAIIGGAGADPGPARERVELGARLFATDWSAVGLVGRAGDGLGPLSNERSCLACHNQGGPGGSGSARSDVLILTDVGSPRLPDGTVDFEKLRATATATAPPGVIFPALVGSPSAVLHRFGADPGYASWRSEVLQRFGLEPRRLPAAAGNSFRVRSSRRNTPALFGAGLIDGISDLTIREMAIHQQVEFPGVAGRPGRLRDGRIGRFGWKAQTATLGDFVRIACANELGLSNPGHPQPEDPFRTAPRTPPGPDLSEAECAALTDYVADLARPVEPVRPALLRAAHIENGRRAFAAAGCNTCHSPEVGEVSGIYSDLLLHDMGQGLSDTGEYYGSSPLPDLAIKPPKGTEWRTPPLWGLRDSAPYLHDGRADTIAQAIEQHGGQAQSSLTAYQRLDRRRKGYLGEFLLSLAAPPSKPDRSR